MYVTWQTYVSQHTTDNSCRLKELSLLASHSGTRMTQPIQSMFTLRTSHRMCTLTCSEHASKSRLTYTQSIWAGLTFKVCGLSATFQVHWPTGFHISAWASTSASSGLAGAYLYLGGCIKWTKMAQLVVRSKHLGQPHVQSASALANGSPY
jgi:hypothetical protein